MRKLGVACSVNLGGTPVLRTLRVGDAFVKGDSVFVFADNEETIQSDDVWIPALVTQVDTTVLCGSDKAMDVYFSGQSAAFTADSVRMGAALRSYVHYDYGLSSMDDGQYYMARTERGAKSGSVPVPIVGPLKSNTGLQFTYLDADGNKTGTATDVRQVAVTVRTHSGVMNSVGETVSDSISAWIYTRN
jgi:hypothetical protein